MDYISGITFTGGDPLHKNNLNTVLGLIKQIRILFGQKKSIWLYSGSNYEEIQQDQSETGKIRQEIISECDVFVDGEFIEEQADVNYPYAGSTNQRVIDVRKTLEAGKVVLWHG